MPRSPMRWQHTHKLSRRANWHTPARDLTPLAHPARGVVLPAPIRRRIPLPLCIGILLLRRYNSKESTMARRCIPILTLMAVLLMAAPNAGAQVDQRCFPETGQCASGRVREFWEQNGGLPVFGF